jgi:NADPH:quinone reductase-like Zn-dependent oxidoreductase
MAQKPEDLSTLTKAIHHEPQTHKVTLTTHSTPTPTPTQYLIRVHAFGITKGELLWPEPCTLPFPIPGFDVSGTILTSPSPTAKYKPGTRVYALTGFERPANAREITVVEESEIAAMPEGICFEDAAAVPMSAETAWQGLFVQGGLKGEEEAEENAEKRVLIIGASGAVGIWAVQLAKWAGVGLVIGVCGTNNVEFVKSLGADEVIDHREVGVGSWVEKGGERSKFDIVIDGVGGDTLKEAWTAPKKDGLLLSITQPVDGMRPETGVSDGVTGTFFIVDPNGDQLRQITGMIEKSKVKPIVDSVWKLDDFEKAWERLESGRARGKVILTV